MLTKENVRNAVERMPDTFTIDDFVEEMILLDKIARARKELSEGKGIDLADFEEETEKWFE